MRSGLKAILAIIAVIGIGAVLVWAFVQGRQELAIEQERERPIKAPLRVSTQEGETVIKLDQATQNQSGIKSAPLKPVTHQEELRAYGMVLDLQPLVDMRNSFATAEAQLEKTRARLDASRKEYERVKALQDNRNVSVKVFQAAEATWHSDEASARAAQTAVSVLQGTVRQRWGGVIASWLFDGAKEFERLMQRQDILLQITLPPGSALSAAPKSAQVQSPEGKFATATLISPSPSTDPRIQGMSFFYLAQARTTDLLPGMNILAFLPTGSQVRGIIVPGPAVVWWQGKAWIYAQKDTERFVRREVSTDAPVENGWFVAKSLLANDRIVTGGAQLLLSEELRSQIQVGD